MTTAHQLTAYLASHRARPFDWRRANCCHFAAGWVCAATGRNPMQGLPATPSAKSALRLVRKLGGSLQAAWTACLGREPIPPASAQVGDLVLVPTVPTVQAPGVGAAVGICVGGTVVLAGDAGGHLYLPLSAATAAWRLRGDDQ
jgi:hypothetical protein